MKPQRWFLALSPDGAARSVSGRVAAAFTERLGADCKSFDTRTYRDAFSRLLKERNDDMTADLLNQSLMVSCLDFHATHLLVLALAPVTLFSLNLLRSYGIITVHWFYEDFRRATYWHDCIAGYDHFCAIQHGPIEQACASSGAAFHFLPTACTLPNAIPLGSERNIDVAFIGIPSPYRIAVLEKLTAAGFTLSIAGEGWQSYRGILQKAIVKKQWTPEEESLLILAHAKIGINLSVDDPHRLDQVHASPRVYDVLASGCILVTENTPLVFESLGGCSFYTFTTPEEACTVIGDRLAEYARLTPVLGENRRAVLENHTYGQRVEELIRVASGR
jgi:hypothetical protein